MSWGRRTLGVALGALAALAVGMGLYAWRALPLTDGELRLDGVRGEIRIERDRHGIPTIRAETLEDASFGLGFVHAQDRLWQLELHRRIGAGRLAEAFGAPLVDTDRFLRALQVRRAAQAQWDALRGEARVLLTAYSAGVNSAWRHAVGARPPEFWILGLSPEAWEPVDTIAWSIMMAWDLGGNWSTELLRLRLAAVLPVDRINQLLPPYPGESPRLTVDYGQRLREWQVAGLPFDADRLLAAAPPSGLEGIGSNNWVVSGAHSETGAPLLANDPHLKLSTPALWYLARLKTPGLDVAGGTIPGLPVVLLGQNEHLAWGFTNTNPDVQDLYLERLDPADPERYQTPEGWARFESVPETIRVRGGDDVSIRVRRSRHGPVISDAGSIVSGVPMVDGPRPAQALALRWTALDPDPGAFLSAFDLQRARSVEEFVAASARHVAPMQNMLVADRDGRIAFVAAGRVPLRGPGHDLHGLVPAPGWDPAYDWLGFLAPEATPRELDPARGWIATANQRIHAPGYPHYLTSEWAPPYRQQRIEALLQSRARHSLESFAAMQADTRSLATPGLLRFLPGRAIGHPLGEAARRALEGFDGDMRADQAAPLIYWAWSRQLARGVFADETGPALYDQALAGRSHREALEPILAAGEAWWCDDKSTVGRQESCGEQSEAALGRALDELRQRFGDDVASWRWGAAHAVRAEHRPFSRVGALAPLFELRAPVGGDTYTVNAARVNLRPEPRTGELYLNEHGPSLRALYDIADPARSRVMQSSGQSGLFFSPHYRDFLSRWLLGESVPLWAPADAGEVDTLVLRPAR